MNRRLAPLLAVMLSVASCTGGVTPTSPTLPTMSLSAVSPAGNWSGAISDPISGSGTMQLSLTEQAPNTLTGTWSMTFTNGGFSGFAVAGLYFGTGYGVVLYVDPPPPCATSSGSGVGSDPMMFSLVDVVVTASKLTAVSGRITCSGPGSGFGTVNLSKQ